MPPFPYLGFGIGLRPQYYQAILQSSPAIDWFEMISEDYFVAGGRHLHYLEQIRQRYPLVMHGVSLSIGGTDPLNKEYLTQLKKLAHRVEPRWISDHLCWTGVEGSNSHDLLPLPYTEEALQHVVARVHQVQDFLGRQILLENVSSYITYRQSQLTEWEFLTAVAEQADCYILLDINNIYVNAFNHGFDPDHYLNAVPVDRIVQFHLAGHTNLDTHLVDTHDHNIIPSVWELYSRAIGRFPRASVMIERDDHIPPLPELLLELEQARATAADIISLETA